MADLGASHWLFTFGFGHTHPETGESLSGKAVRFEGTYAEARAKMVERFGIKWAFQYADGPGPVGVIQNANGRGN